MGNFVFAAKDIAAANVTLPVARGLAALGHEIYASVEATAVPLYEGQGFNKILSGTDPATIMHSLRPSAVVTGLSYPITNEQSYGLAANLAGVPLVEVEDFWGAHVRSRALPDYVGAIDCYAVGLARRRYSRAGATVSGNPGVREKPYQPSPEARERVEAFRKKHGPAIVLLLGLEWDVAPFAAECFGRMRKDFGIIPRIHPKVLDAVIPSGDTYAAFYAHVLAPWGTCTDAMSNLKTDDVAVCADAVVTGTSTVLLTAAQAGVPAISLWTAQTAHAVRDSGGIDEYPPASYGMPCLREQADLFDVIAPPPPRLQAELRPYRPDRLIEVLDKMAH